MFLIFKRKRILRKTCRNIKWPEPGKQADVHTYSKIYISERAERLNTQERNWLLLGTYFAFLQKLKSK